MKFKSLGNGGISSEETPHFGSTMWKVTFVLAASEQCVKTADQMVYTWKSQCIIYVCGMLLICENTKIINYI